jgi:hypothetical protein
MKTIIALWHFADRGKTSTLIELKNLLLAEINKDEDIQVNEISNNGKDITLIVKLYGKIIGIESQGDPNTYLKTRLEDLLVKNQIDYLFCATRTKGTTVEDVLHFKSEDVSIVWDSTYQTYDENKFDFFNKLKAKHLFDLFKSLIQNNNPQKYF